MAQQQGPEGGRGSRSRPWYSSAVPDPAAPLTEADVGISAVVLERVLSTEVGRVGWLLGFLAGSALLEKDEGDAPVTGAET